MHVDVVLVQYVDAKYNSLIKYDIRYLQIQFRSGSE